MNVKFLSFFLSIFLISGSYAYAQQWAVTYGGSNYDRANSIRQTSDGGYIVAGWTGSFGSGGEDTLVLKLNGDGSVLWQSTYGGIGTDWANSIQQTTDGGYNSAA